MSFDTTLHLADLTLPPLVALGVFIVRKLWDLDIRLTSLHAIVTTKFRKEV